MDRIELSELGHMLSSKKGDQLTIFVNLDKMINYIISMTHKLEFAKVYSILVHMGAYFS